MPAPVLKVEFGFGSTWKTEDASIVWDDETVYVLQTGLSVSRGRSSELDDFRAGTCSFTLDNRNRRFDPQYASSPHVGNLVPGVPVRVSATPSGQSEQTIFRGFVQGWPQDYALGNKMSTVSINAVDGFGKLATAGLPSSVYAIEVAADTPDVWYRLSETAGNAMGDSSGNGFDGGYEGSTTQKSARHPNDYETTPGLDMAGDQFGYTPTAATCPSARPCAFEAVVKIERTDDTRSMAAVFTGSGSTTRFGDLLIGTFGGEWALFGVFCDGTSTATNVSSAFRPFDGNTHHIAYRLGASGDGKVYIDGEDVTASSSDLLASTLLATSGTLVGNLDTGYGSSNFIGSIGDVAVYHSNLTAARVLDHANAALAPWDGDLSGARIERILDLVEWPSDLRTIATGLTVMGPATLGSTALPQLQRIESAEQGRLFINRNGDVTLLDRYYNLTVTAGNTAQATFSDDGSDIPYSTLGYDYDDRLVKNRIRGSRKGGADVEVFDQTSIDTYGERADSDLSGLDLPTDAAVQSLIEGRLDKYKDPALRPRPIEIKLHGRTAAQQATVLGLELGYRVNLERTPLGVGSAIDQDFIIESIDHRMGNGEHNVTLTLSPVDTKVYGLWGSGLWDTALWAA